jgi:DNA-binding transcriptional LysR family regulator
MEIRHLRYVIAIAEERNLTRAAERLGMQQPPLSQQLQALERELGVRLFERLPRGVELTAAGSAFLEDARGTLAGLAKAAARSKRVAAGIEGTLSIGVASSAATHSIVPRIIAAFREGHPGVHLSFVEGNAASLTEALIARQVQVALLRAPVERPPEVRFVQVLKEPMLAALPANHPVALEAAKRRTPSISLRQLCGVPLILTRRPGAPGMYADLLAACAADDLEPTIAAEVGNMLTNLLLVAAGVGASVVPASMRGIQGELVSYMALRGARALVAPLTLVSLRDDRNPAAARFAQVARELARDSSLRRTGR